jgi:hypothetical protein
MPPVQSAETLAALGIIVGVVMFLIGLVIIGVLMLTEELVLQGKKLHVFLLLRQNQNK